MLVFVALVSICSIVAFIITNQVWFEPVLKQILGGYAKISSGMLNVFGQGTKALGSTISSSSFSIDVKKGCDALAPMLLLTFGTVFFPATWQHKLKGLGIGLLLLAVINIIRIVSLFLIGKYTNSRIFDIFHVDIWQIFFIILAMLIWITWLKGSGLQVKKA